MAKKIKQMEMDALKATFKGVRDLVLLTASGINSQVDNQMRLSLRKKKIRLQMVKNSLARRVFDEMGIKVARWEGPTVVAWGGDSLSELSKELEALRKKNDKFKPKGAVSEGQEIDFAKALKMPTRAEAIGRIVSLAMSPASRLLGQIASPASRIASQLKTLSEKTEAAPPPAPAEAAATT